MAQEETIMGTATEPLRSTIQVNLPLTFGFRAILESQYDDIAVVLKQLSSPFEDESTFTAGLTNLRSLLVSIGRILDADDAYHADNNR